MASINVIDDALLDMILTKLPPAILSVVFLHTSTTPADDGPDSFLIIDVTCAISNWSALVRNSDWHLRLYGDRQIDRCISMIPEYCDFEPPMEHAFYKASILLRIAPEQTSDTSLDSVTEQRWWDVLSAIDPRINQLHGPCH
ncbi:hypothetical protein EDD22DRAFT_953058 [Suillus occidentalis]|nr:hypothetical protein EDD22DRAFT_953058 [Suillus occidentalis]